MWGEAEIASSAERVARKKRRTRREKEAVLLPSMTLDPGAGARQAPAQGFLGKLYHRTGSFQPELGGALREVTLAYETWGDLDAAGENAVLIVHALTGDSHAAGEPEPAHRRGGWWSPMVGPGLAIDTERYFVVCSNVLGGCYGSTGPASLDPEGGRP